MNLLVDPHGGVRCLYSEVIDLTKLGTMSIRRVSMVEPDHTGNWWADLKILGGPRLGPYPRRSEALEAEVAWVERFLFETRHRPEVDGGTG
jgi:hypothetical protein